jgi:hypothetical protein
MLAKQLKTTLQRTHCRQIGSQDIHLSQAATKEESPGFFRTSLQPTEQIGRDPRSKTVGGQFQAPDRHCAHPVLLRPPKQHFLIVEGHPPGKQMEVPDPKKIGSVLMMRDAMNAAEEKSVGHAQRSSPESQRRHVD